MKPFKLIFLVFIFTISFSSCRNMEPGSYTETVNGISFNMIFVQGGTFTMGEENDSPDYTYVEYPHLVKVNDFFLAETEVTQELYQAVMGVNPSWFSDISQMYNPKWENGVKNRPVEMVTWTEAQEFCRRLSDMTGKNYVLPTQAEWEYAARGGKYHEDTKFSGSNNDRKVAWCLDENHVKNLQTHKVATKAPNALGLYDMTGNVSELCSDFLTGCYRTSFEDNPQGPSKGVYKVFRGGSFRKVPEYCFVWKCSGGLPILSSSMLRCLDDVGFRIAMIPEGRQPQVLTDLDSVSTDKNYIEHVGSQSFQMIAVESGHFYMGATLEQTPLGEPGDDEWPVHRVTLSEFYMSSTEVTQGQFKEVMGFLPESLEEMNDSLPISKVTWNEANLYCDKLSTLTGKNYALPTEAQWEYAARCGKYGTNLIYSNISGLSSRNTTIEESDYRNYAWFKSEEESSEENYENKVRPHKVAQLRPNYLGLYDMSGNVWEWCSDWYGSYSREEQVDPEGPYIEGLCIGREKVMRGGSCTDDVNDVAISMRNKDVRENCYTNVGFRVVMNP